MPDITPPTHTPLCGDPQKLDKKKKDNFWGNFMGKVKQFQSKYAQISSYLLYWIWYKTILITERLFGGIGILLPERKNIAIDLLYEIGTVSISHMEKSDLWLNKADQRNLNLTTKR